MAEVIGTTFTEDVDRLTARLAAMDSRMSDLEERLADAAEAAILVPDQDDLLEARVRSAHLAADLHLVAIDLRSELRRLRDDLPPVERPDAEELAERLVDLTLD
jgi:hypothetical protein